MDLKISGFSSPLRAAEYPSPMEPDVVAKSICHNY